MNKEQITSMLLSINTDLELFGHDKDSYYVDRAKKRLERLIEARKEHLLPIDKHDLTMLQLKVEAITLS